MSTERIRTLHTQVRASPEELARIDRIAAHIRRGRSDVLRAASDRVILAEVNRAVAELEAADHAPDHGMPSRVGGGAPEPADESAARTTRRTTASAGATR
jgi:hypothetical protein